MQLWAEHLRLPPDALIDPIASEVHWSAPRPHDRQRVSPYRIELAQGGGAAYYRWQDYPYGDYEAGAEMAVADPAL
jgi:hypothetical protein